jgi:hypothetical protein
MASVRRLSKPMQYFGWLLAIGWALLVVGKFTDFIHSRRTDLTLEYALTTAAFFLCSIIWAYRALHPTQSCNGTPEINNRNKAKG